jgi:NAD(P)H-dependent flavin oxidoreductase YrpB (nitropropane dioxygenase family)
MWQTEFTRDYDLNCPFVAAGMAMIAEPALVAAVCAAGGLGQLGTGPLPPALLQEKIRAVRALTSRTFAVNLIVEETALGPATTEDHIARCAEERVPVVVFFWNTPPREWIARLRRAGCRIWVTVASVADVQAAEPLGFDAFIVQGREAGGHVRAKESLFTLLAAVGAVTRRPLVAAGGIGHGRIAAAAFAAGASAVCVGTRLVAAAESAAHPEYKARLVAARAEDTVVTEMFGPEWPGAPMRVLMNRALRRSAAPDGAAAVPATIGETEVFGRHYVMPEYSALLPTVHTRGDFDEMCLAAGEGVGFIRAVQPAAAIIAEIMDEARSALAADASGR